MGGHQKLLSLWVWLLLMAALCPGAQYTYSKRGYGVRGRGKGDGNKVPPSWGLSKQGLKWAGTAVGVPGGTGTGYGLGFLGRPKHGSKNHYDRMTATSEQNQRPYYNKGQGHYNQSVWRAIVNAAAPAAMTNIFLTFAHVVSIYT
uniref:Shadow of prion protein n=1 Tax=Mastacembelus armatus TaxID=205130 RepID=A0A3Q3M2U5_9TELE